MSACSLKWALSGSRTLAYRPSRGDSAASGDGMGLYYTDDENFPPQRCERSARLPAVQQAPRAAAGVSRRRFGAPAGRRPGAGKTRARERNSVERSVGRCAARLAGDGSRNVLRHLAHRDRADRLVLSRHGGRRRPAADAAVRAALAAEVSRGATSHRAHAPRRLLRAALLPRREAKTIIDTNGACLSGVSA